MKATTMPSQKPQIQLAIVVLRCLKKCLNSV